MKKHTMVITFLVVAYLCVSNVVETQEAEAKQASVPATRTEVASSVLSGLAPATYPQVMPEQQPTVVPQPAATPQAIAVPQPATTPVTTVPAPPPSPPAPVETSAPELPDDTIQEDTSPFMSTILTRLDQLERKIMELRTLLERVLIPAEPPTIEEPTMQDLTASDTTKKIELPTPPTDTNGDIKPESVVGQATAHAQLRAPKITTSSQGRQISINVLI